MTEAELQQIQAVCREWLTQADSTNGSRLTIPEGGGLSRSFELRINGLLAFDNVLILSANDEGTGACYAKLIRQPDGLEELVDTSFEKIAQHLASTSETTAADMRPTQQRYQETMEKLVEAQQAGVHQVTAWPDRWWIERDNDDTAVEPKYLLFTNRKLLGHSLLERTRSDGRKSGRFEPSLEYFDYADIFAAAPRLKTTAWKRMRARLMAYPTITAANIETSFRSCPIE